MKRVSNGIVLCVSLVVLTAFTPARPTATYGWDRPSVSNNRVASEAGTAAVCLPAASNSGAEPGTRTRLPYCHCSWSQGSCSTWVHQFAQEWEMHINCGGNTYEYQGSGEWGGLCRPGWECPSGSGHNSHNSGNVPHL